MTRGAGPGRRGASARCWGAQGAGIEPWGPAEGSQPRVHGGQRFCRRVLSTPTAGAVLRDTANKGPGGGPGAEGLCFAFLTPVCRWGRELCHGSPARTGLGGGDTWGAEQGTRQRLSGEGAGSPSCSCNRTFCFSRCSEVFFPRGAVVSQVSRARGREALPQHAAPGGTMRAAPAWLGTLRGPSWGPCDALRGRDPRGIGVGSSWQAVPCHPLLCRALPSCAVPSWGPRSHPELCCAERCHAVDLCAPSVGVAERCHPLSPCPDRAPAQPVCPGSSGATPLPAEPRPWRGPSSCTEGRGAQRKAALVPRAGRRGGSGWVGRKAVPARPGLPRGTGTGAGVDPRPLPLRLPGTAAAMLERQHRDVPAARGAWRATGPVLTQVGLQERGWGWGWGWPPHGAVSPTPCTPPRDPRPSPAPGSVPHTHWGRRRGRRVVRGGHGPNTQPCSCRHVPAGPRAREAVVQGDV